MTPGGSDVRRAEAMNERDGEIAQGRHDLGGVASAQAGAIFSKADIAHIMGAVFDAPMASVEFQQACRTRLGGRKGGDEIDDLSRGVARFGHGAGELGHLRQMRPGGRQIGIHLATGLDGAHLGASPSPVNGLGLQIAGVGIRKVGLQVGVERGLVAFDSQDGVGFQVMQEAEELGVGVQGIGRTDPLADGQRRQHLFGDGNLVGFLVDAHLEEGLLTLMGHKGEQMRSRLLPLPGSPHRLAIQGQRLVSGGPRRGLYPGPQHPLNGGSI